MGRRLLGAGVGGRKGRGVPPDSGVVASSGVTRQKPREKTLAFHEAGAGISVSMNSKDRSTEFFNITRRNIYQDGKKIGTIEFSRNPNSLSAKERAGYYDVTLTGKKSVSGKSMKSAIKKALAN